MTCPVFVGIRSDDFDTAAELRKLAHGRADIGAIVTFTGLCRNESGTLSALELERYPGMAEAAAGLVKSLDMENRVLISSFDHEQLVSVRRLSENIATGVLTGDRLAKPGAYLALCQVADRESGLPHSVLGQFVVFTVA